MIRLLLTLYIVRGIQAAPVANTTASIDSVEVPTLDNRTMWSIVSSCALTLFACIYSTIHPNIPSPKDGPVRILWRRLGIMIMALIFPELIATWAMRQWLCARRVTTQFKASELFSVCYPQERSEICSSVDIECAEAPSGQHELEDHESTQALVARVKGCEDSQTLAGRCKKWLKACVLQESEDYAWTETHSFFVLMGGFMLYVNDEPYHTLSPDNLLKMAKSGSIDVPKLSAMQIRDKSKGNMISKGLVILQVAWFVLQLISRKIYHLETTQLEAGALAFAVLSFIAYTMWWNKPLDIQCPHPVYWTLSGSEPEDSYFDEHVCTLPSCTAETDCVCFSVYSTRSLNLPHVLLDTIINPLSQLLGLMDNFTTEKYRVLTFDGSNEVNELDQIILALAGFVMATVFGGIHCIAWFFAFPTYQEQVLWRMSAVAIIFIPWLALLVGAVSALFKDVHILGDALVIEMVFIISALMYIIGRAFLLILMVTTLRNLPPGAYEAVSWTSLIPHL
ncbi:hypothetical protein M405DRAFT_822859 [Rhizopogon salebrosus TDB-379]|nr:hypothetical protein M405DRAFT_822859 [Rhizopogon salebrosus TDB-379]